MSFIVSTALYVKLHMLGALPASKKQEYMNTLEMAVIWQCVVHLMYLNISHRFMQ